MYCRSFELAFFIVIGNLLVAIMATGSNSNSDSKEYVLVRWIEDESVGVMPLSAVAKGYSPSPGATIRMKWRGKKEYEAEVLKISRT